MKKKLYSLLCIALIAVLCFSLAACSGKEAGGLGNLDMGDDPNKTEGVGTLGEPSDTSSPDTTPESSSDTTPDPAPSGMSTEKYGCDAFSVTIPAGWQVKYDIFDPGTGTNSIIISVTDPSDSNNSFFFLTEMEPFFTSVAAKNACLPYVVGYYELAPVMNGTPSAEETLRLWPNVFQVLQAEGLGYDAYFRNYTVNSVLGSQVAEGSTNSDMTSAVTAMVTIPGTDKLYQMYFQNNLVLDAPAQGLPGSATYYRSYTNYGAVLREDLADQYPSLMQCLQSFEFNNA